KINDISNRESVILIVGVSAAGYVVLAYIIFKTDPIEDFLDNNLNNSIRFAKLLIGFLNVELTLDWLKYFNYYSFYSLLTFIKLREEDSYELGEEGFTFAKWFGCN
ncbi:hypothetical protein QBC45DRAFT_337378, partial [Copromyces sp. CBS 386.78]